MKKIFTLIAFAFLAGQSISQTCALVTGASCPGVSETFNTAANGFTGDFSWGTQGGNGRLESTPVSSGTTKRLRTPTLFLPANATTLSTTFTIAGNAGVSGFTLSAQT
ncbi:MAG TPA: hypothetical protein VNA26_08275, partial [Chitinophagaceae bacterium]|nr:hypothetical protein [Chitinophagaceae bacterium]